MKKTLSLVILAFLLTTRLKSQTACASKGDFSFYLSLCSPSQVTFSTSSNNFQQIRWFFGDLNTQSGLSTVTHTYSGMGTYPVTLITDYPSCSDTVTKNITISVLNDPLLISTNDTTICAGSSKQINTIPTFTFCWTPSTGLDNPLSSSPVVSPAQTTTYYKRTLQTGTNLIVNGDFSQGNQGFTSQYAYTSNNTTEGEYYIGPNPSAWYFAHYPCTDHTTGTGNMLLVNGSPQNNTEVWKTTVTITPHTNYAFSTWISSISLPNPAQLAFSINGNTIGSLITASQPPCNWQQFYTTWNSGPATSAVISIINKNTVLFGNDFALDDISFAPFILKQDSVRITVDKPVLVSTTDPSICIGESVQLSTSGADSYTWTPGTGLSATTIPDPVASPAATTTYYVTGTNVRNCTSRDTIIVTVNPLPVITVNKSGDISCAVDAVQLQADGAATYSWSPIVGLSAPGIAAPLASPADTTTYTVTGTDLNGCKNSGQITVNVTETGKSLNLMPTAFTPNNDGINDCYGIRYWGVIEELDFSIYNRWGERVFHTKEAGKCWNGYHRGILQEPDVFVYMIRAKTTCGEIFRKGSFALIR